MPPSKYWKVFKIVDASDGNKVECLLCEQQLTRSGSSTGSMAHHVNAKHPGAADDKTQPKLR